MNKIKDAEINLTAKQEEKLERFCKILKEYNEKFNLTSITDDEEIYEKHFADSLKGEEFFPLNAKVIEIGSGGGFPSVPLKIAREDLYFTLLEATEKKCGYLRNVGKELSFENFKVVCGRAEEFGKKAEYREKFDVALDLELIPHPAKPQPIFPFSPISGNGRASNLPLTASSSFIFVGP